jgi:hypothetical protein
MPKHEFTVPFIRFDTYTNDGPEMVEFEEMDGPQQDYVVFARSAWEAMGRPERVRVTVEPSNE